MENSDPNELIERYLDGSLSPAERQAAETRLANDPGFQAQLELHRQLHEEFADPQKLELRDLLVDIMQKPPAGKRAWRKGLGLALLILLAGWIGWRWLSPVAEPAPAVPEETKSVPAPDESAAIPENRDTPTSPRGKAPQRPIAMINPAAFTPNQDFERRLGNNLRSVEGSVEIQSPAPGTNFSLKNGMALINFQGTVPASSDTAAYPLDLKIYDNLSVIGQAPLFRIQPAITSRNNASATWIFSSSQRLRLPPGLYYFIVEGRADEDLLFVGKFLIGGK